MTSPSIPSAKGTPKGYVTVAIATTGSGSSERVIPGMYFIHDHDDIGRRTPAVQGAGVKRVYTTNSKHLPVVQVGLAV